MQRVRHGTTAISEQRLQSNCKRFGEAGLALMGGGGALRQAFARTVKSTVGTSADIAAQAGGAGSARFVRTDWSSPVKHRTQSPTYNNG